MSIYFSSTNAMLLLGTLNFFPKDDNLGEFMSTVCGFTCEDGQVWVHARWRGVGDGPDPAGGRLGVH